MILGNFSFSITGELQDNQDIPANSFKGDVTIWSTAKVEGGEIIVSSSNHRALRSLLPTPSQPVGILYTAALHPAGNVSITSTIEEGDDVTTSSRVSIANTVHQGIACSLGSPDSFSIAIRYANILANTERKVSFTASPFNNAPHYKMQSNKFSS